MSKRRETSTTPVVTVIASMRHAAIYDVTRIIKQYILEKIGACL